MDSLGKREDKRDCIKNRFIMVSADHSGFVWWIMCCQEHHWTN